MCTYSCLCACVGTHRYMCIWKPEVSIGCLSPSVPIFFFLDRILLLIPGQPETLKTRLALNSKRSISFCVLGAGIKGMCHGILTTFSFGNRISHRIWRSLISLDCLARESWASSCLSFPKLGLQAFAVTESISHGCRRAELGPQALYQLYLTRLCSSGFSSTRTAEGWRSSLLRASPRDRTT